MGSGRPDKRLGVAGNVPGEIVAGYGRRYLVECGASSLLQCVPRGKRGTYVCGDRVGVRPTGPDQGVIEGVVPRETTFQRSVAHRTKVIAANATQVAAVCAVEPSFADELVARMLVAAENQGMKVLIVLNKADLADSLDDARRRLAPFESAGYPVVVMSAITDVAPILVALADEVTVLAGQSGMGKSTLLNGLVPEANRATREISAFLGTGRHATTHARMYRIDGAAVIDCPGLQQFGLAHLSATDIEAAFPDFLPHLGHCRFADCHHRAEPGCAIRSACGKGRIHPRRLELFHRMVRGTSVERRAT